MKFKKAECEEAVWSIMVTRKATVTVALVFNNNNTKYKTLKRK